MLHTMIRKRVSLHTLSAGPAYTTARGISLAKHKDLKCLNNKVIPSNYHGFYNTLKKDEEFSSDSGDME